MDEFWKWIMLVTTGAIAVAFLSRPSGTTSLFSGLNSFFGQAFSAASGSGAFGGAGGGH